MPYISRMTGTNTPWIKASPSEEEELEAEYGDLDIIILPTLEGMMEIRRVSDEEAARLSPPGSEEWLTES